MMTTENKIKRGTPLAIFFHGNNARFGIQWLVTLSECYSCRELFSEATTKIIFCTRKIFRKIFMSQAVYGKIYLIL